MMYKFSVKLMALNCVESITYLYPEKGHTHGPLDATVRQTYVKLHLEELEDDTDVVDILDHFCEDLWARCWHSGGSKGLQSG